MTPTALSLKCSCPNQERFLPEKLHNFRSWGGGGRAAAQPPPPRPPARTTMYGYYDFGINQQREVIMTHQIVSLGKYWKLFPATLKISFS